MKKWVAGILMVSAANAAYAIDLGDKAEYGQIKGDFRVRHEGAKQKGLAETANANTARLRLGYLTPTYEGLSGYVEGEAIRIIGDADFNDGGNGKTTYPSVNDPMDTAVNQAYLNYKLGDTGNSITIGRQYLVYDNQRWVGWSKFRQNDTTQDAINLVLQPIKDLELSYAYSYRVHRSLGTRQTAGTYEGDINLFHASYKLPEDLKLIGYAYLLDFDDAATSSSNTYGSRLEWRAKKATDWSFGINPIATIEFAHQDNGDNNPNKYNEWYNWFEFGGEKNGYQLIAVYERLGGNGHGSISTPIGTNHSFTGWVDRIDTPPVNGLVDNALYGKMPIALPWKDQKLNAEAQYHYFTADNTDKKYGTEIDLALKYSPIKNHTFGLEFGTYSAQKYLSDTSKLWLSYETQF